MNVATKIGGVNTQIAESRMDPNVLYDCQEPLSNYPQVNSTLTAMHRPQELPTLSEIWLGKL